MPAGPNGSSRKLRCGVPATINRIVLENCDFPKAQIAELTGKRSYTLMVTSVLFRFAEAREDVLLRPRLCFGGMFDVCVDVQSR